MNKPVMHAPDTAEVIRAQITGLSRRIEDEAKLQKKLVYTQMLFLKTNMEVKA